MVHISAGWESHSLKYKRTYASGVKNLALATSAGDAPACCSKESRAVASSAPRNPSNKAITICKIEIRAILVAASYKLTNTNKTILFAPKSLMLLPPAFDSAATERAYSGVRGFFPVMSMLGTGSLGKKSWDSNCLRASA